jgi:hypothetical protein
MFGILFVCVTILPVTLVSQPTAGADRPQAALPAATIYSDNVVERSAPNWEAKCISLSRRVKQAMDM